MGKAKMSFDSSNPTQIGNAIYRSDAWLVLRRDKEGIHLHLNNEEGLALIVDFLSSSDEIREIVIGALKSEGLI